MKSKVFKTVAKAAPIVAPFIPGVGPLTAAAIGAAGGALSGGGLKGAALGGAAGYLGGGGASSIASKAGLGQLGTSALTTGLKGASIGGYLGGDLKSALTAGGLAAAGGALLSGANIPFLGSASQSAASGVGPPTPGTGILGKITAPIKAGGLSSLTGGGNVGLGSLMQAGGTLYGGFSTNQANKEIQRQLLAAQGKAQNVLSPYSETGLQAQQQLSQRLTEGFSPQDLENDPGYQFQLQQGNQALERSLAAQGMGQSGAALKAAQEYGQGLASQSYGDAYNRYLSQNSQISDLAGQGLSASRSLADVFGNQGNIQGMATSAQNNNINKTLASLLSGRGYFDEVDYGIKS
jgi:hypothetical protein